MVEILEALNEWFQLRCSFPGRLVAHLANVAPDELEVPQGLQCYIEEAVQVVVSVLKAKLPDEKGPLKLSFLNGHDTHWLGHDKKLLRLYFISILRRRYEVVLLWEALGWLDSR